nr:RHS repeat protein [Spirochaetota bacterium]
KGELIHEKINNGYEKWNKYDGKGNLIREKDSDENENRYEYDGKGNLIYGISAYGSEWWQENSYHPNGRLKKVVTWYPVN